MAQGKSLKIVMEELNKSTQHPNELIEVAIGLVFNPQQEVLMAKRGAHQHLAGCWEFPGGKINQNETAIHGLKRELFEEVGLEVLKARSFLKCFPSYATKHLCLRIFWVDQYIGQPYSKEGQPVQWMPIHRMDQLKIPPANRPIIEKLKQCLSIE